MIGQLRSFEHFMKKTITIKYYRSRLKAMTLMINELKFNLDSTRKELNATNAKVDAVLPKLIRSSGRRDIEGRRFRIVTYIDENMVHECFVHGDRTMIGYFAERAGHQIARELNSINFYRNVQTNQEPQYPQMSDFHSENLSRQVEEK